MRPCPACRVGRNGAVVPAVPLALCLFAASAVKAHSGSQIIALRGGGPRTLPTQPWLIEGLPPEEDPAGNIWETRSWRERIRQHQEEKAARKWTQHDAYGPVHYVCTRPCVCACVWRGEREAAGGNACCSLVSSAPAALSRSWVAARRKVSE
jgi:hypothetical protein